MEFLKVSTLAASSRGRRNVCMSMIGRSANASPDPVFDALRGAIISPSPTYVAASGADAQCYN